MIVDSFIRYYLIHKKDSRFFIEEPAILHLCLRLKEVYLFVFAVFVEVEVEPRYAVLQSNGVRQQFLFCDDEPAGFFGGHALDVAIDGFSQHVGRQVQTSCIGLAFHQFADVAPQTSLCEVSSCMPVVDGHGGA